jgi:hypothetical protein
VKQSLVKVHFQAIYSNVLGSGDDAGQHFVENNQENCLLTISGCIWLFGMVKNLAENKTTLHV